MPTYAYHCRECDSDFEVKQRFSEDALTDCIVCGAEDAVFRVIQPAGVVFKGSGWYITDSRSSKNSNLTPPKKGDSTDTKSTTSDDSGSSTKSSSDSSSSNNSSAAEKSA